MLTLTEIGTVFALVGGTVFYVLLLSLSNREKAARNRDLQRRLDEQAGQIQAIEARLRYLETALCRGEDSPAVHDFAPVAAPPVVPLGEVR